MKCLLVAVTCCALMQAAVPLSTFHVYPTRHRPLHNTSTTISTEERVGNVVYEVFRRRSDPKRELFRIQVGKYVQQEFVKTWNYGIETEADVTGDGQPDYVWYGGDDTSESIVLFISSASGYVRTDVIKTAESAWEHRFEKRAPDFAALDSEYGIGRVVVERSNADLTLIVGIRKNFASSKTALMSLRISQKDFKP